VVKSPPVATWEMARIAVSARVLAVIPTRCVWESGLRCIVLTHKLLYCKKPPVGRVCVVLYCSLLGVSCGRK